MNDFEIEFLSGNESEGDALLPINFIEMGKVEIDDIKIYINKDVYEELEKYSCSDTSKELGTILIGEYCKSFGKPNVIISDYIIAKYTDASASTLTFTHDTWNYVHSEHDKKYNDKKIIGWQHTHPNYGIFLSNYDLFIHENFFNLDFQIAYVIDPIQKLRGFFQWKNGKIKKLDGFYIYSDDNKPIKIEQTDKTETLNSANNIANKKATIPIILLLVANIVFSCVLGINLKNITKENRKLSETISVIEAESQQQRFESFGSETSDVSDENQITENVSVDTVRFEKYVIVDGDTLTDICNKHNVDYRKYRSIILSVNGIENENEIYSGKIILIPVSVEY